MALKTFCELMPDYENGCFAKENGRLKRVYGKEALKIWIEKALRPQCRRYGFEAYGKNYGHEIAKLIGLPINQNVVLLIIQSIREFLCANPYILNVSLKEYKAEASSLSITLSIFTVYDDIEITEVYTA